MELNLNASLPLATFAPFELPVAPRNKERKSTFTGGQVHASRNMLRLLENDDHWELVLREAALTATAEQVKDLFAIILTTCSPSNSNRLEKLKEKHER
ncbi:hypothetical protein CEXT_272121 [Caerostris extrusa]|uniref:Uncharacterized protein n=1 Tax=Caerostris extrusa TaxID=172846 RepID=A0AAV4PQT8_CAEEX|nr:hypothetical protein CEXT_272121 [Caerostris extrusa]